MPGLKVTAAGGRRRGSGELQKGNEGGSSMRPCSFLSSLCLRRAGGLDQPSLHVCRRQNHPDTCETGLLGPMSGGTDSVVLGEGLRPGVSKTFLVLLLLLLRGGHMENCGLRSGLPLLNSLKKLA